MIALLTACLFFWNPCARANLHQQKRALKLCSATLRWFLSIALRIPSVHDFYVIYQTRGTVFHRDIQTPRRELKIRRAAEYFWRNSRCLDNRWNTVSSVWIYLLNRNKNEGVNGEVKSSKSMLIKTGYPNLLHGCDFLCLSLMNY